jgi:hypothetical protein
MGTDTKIKKERRVHPWESMNENSVLETERSWGGKKE